MSSPLVSILILNYNGKKFLKDCFESVLASSYPNYEVWLIDNESTDNSVKYTKEHFPNIRVLETGKNGGYSYAYNCAFKVAKGKYCILLNNDVKVEKNWIEPLVYKAESDSIIGALQPKLVSMPNPEMFEYAGASGGYLDMYGFPFLRGRVVKNMEKDEGQYDDEKEIFWASGAALFIRKEVLKETGTLDEEFVHHMEEIDLCWRVHLAGYKIMVIPSSKIYHYGGATIAPDSYMKLYWNHRNSIFMLLKNFGKKKLYKIVIKRMLLDLMAMSYTIINMNFTHFKAIFAGYIWLLKNGEMIRKKRDEVQKMRKVGDDNILKMLYPKSIAIQYFLKGKKTYKELIK